MPNDVKTDNVAKYVTVLISALPVRQTDIISKRFGLKDGRRRTLEEIGDEYGITRERVRQIEQSAKAALSESAHMERLEGFFKIAEAHFREYGGMRAERQLLEEDVKNILLPALKVQIAQTYVHFLLSLRDSFIRHAETDDFHAVWALKDANFDAVKQSVNELVEKLRAHRQPVPREVLFQWFAGLTEDEKVHVLESYLRMSKQVGKNTFEEYGLSDWPEISVRGVRDKAHLVLKKRGQPMHFRDIVDNINETFHDGKEAHPQTVHNELIKNDKFVLVGRGMYALSDWGYKPGKVVDVLVRVFKGEDKPLSKEEVIKAVMKERNVKPNTIALNLQNKAYFEKMDDGRFVLKI